jgi:hypothetical protein
MAVVQGPHLTFGMMHDAPLLSQHEVRLPSWVVDPEDPRFIEGIERAMGTKILPPDVVTSHFSIFKCLVVPGGGVAKGHGPSIDVLTSTGNHSGILMCSNNFPDVGHTKAYLMFRPMVDSDDTWCSTFERRSNSIGVAQLAYGKFIEVFDNYFVTGTFTSTQLEELFDALNKSIDVGRDIFTNKLRDLLTRIRKRKAKEEENGRIFKDKRTYEEFIFYITDVLRYDLLKVVGPSFQIGSLATLELTGTHDTYTTRNDGGPVTETFKRAAYNSFIIITVTTKNGDIITIQTDIRRSSLLKLGINNISFWNGQLIEYTTTDAFIKQVIDKLAAAATAGTAGASAGTGTGPGGHVDAAAADAAREALLQIMKERKKDRSIKFGSNTAITTGCQVPMLFYYKLYETPTPKIEVDIVFPPRLRDSYESVVGMDPNASKEQGYTGYFILCPSFLTHFGVQKSNNVLFFCNYPSMRTIWFNFPDYGDARSAKVIGDNEGDLQDSMHREVNSLLELSPSPSSLPDTHAADAVAASSASSASLPRLDSADVGNPLAVAGAASTLLDVEVEVSETNPPSFFRSIFNKCVSYFFSARVGDIRQTQTNFVDDDLNVDKLLIRNAFELADDVYRAQDELLVHAARHALDAVFDLIGAFELGETNTELQVMINLARAAADAAPAASADIDMVRNCFNVAAFAVRGVACICACKNVERNHPYSQMLLKLSELLSGSYTIDDVAVLIDDYDYNNIVTDQTEQALVGSSKKQKRGAGRLRSRRYLHRVSRKRKRTLKKKNISRKYSKYSSGYDRIRTRSFRRSRRSYSRKIGKYNR